MTESFLNEIKLEKTSHLYDDVADSEASYCYADEVVTTSQSIRSYRESDDFLLDEPMVRLRFIYI